MKARMQPTRNRGSLVWTQRWVQQISWYSAGTAFSFVVSCKRPDRLAYNFVTPTEIAHQRAPEDFTVHHAPNDTCIHEVDTNQRSNYTLSSPSCCWVARRSAAANTAARSAVRRTGPLPRARPPDGGKAGSDGGATPPGPTRPNACCSSDAGDAETRLKPEFCDEGLC